MFTLRRVLIGGVLAAVALVVVASAGWWFFIREDNKLATASPNIPQDLVGATSASDTPAVAADPLTYKILPDRSEAAYFADEKLASLPLPSKAKGSTKDISGEFHLTADGFDLDTTKTSQFTVNLKTIKSDKDMRDQRVQNIALETSKFPTAIFTATKVTGFDNSIPAGQEQTLQLTGMLDLHGVQKEVTWEVLARREGNVITGLATTSFKYGDFNIPVLKVANFVSVQDGVTLQATIVAQTS
ncbi:MAG: YceI family protein [Chloroflexota bacterium]|nr:YceI family protein [Chloroflexota bacterium]